MVKPACNENVREMILSLSSESQKFKYITAVSIKDTKADDNGIMRSTFGSIMFEPEVSKPKVEEDPTPDHEGCCCDNIFAELDKDDGVIDAEISLCPNGRILGGRLWRLNMELL